MKLFLTPFACAILLAAASAHAQNADTDRDGVADASDICPYTPPQARVDRHGCALDQDFDGVADGLDICPKSPFGIPVNPQGCGREEAPTAVAAAPSANPAEATPEAASEPAPAAPAEVAAAPVAPAVKPEAAAVDKPRSSTTKPGRVIQIAPIGALVSGGLPPPPPVYAPVEEDASESAQSTPKAPLAVAAAPATETPDPMPPPAAPAPIPTEAPADHAAVATSEPESEPLSDERGINPDHADLLPYLNDHDALLDAIDRRNRARDAADERASQQRLSKMLDEREPLSEDSVFGAVAAARAAAGGSSEPAPKPARKPVAAPAPVVRKPARILTPAPAPTPRTVATRNTERLFADVPFAAGSSKLNPAASKTLEKLTPELARVMQGLPNLRVEVVGHADAATEGARAEKLAGERAIAVNAYLIGKGVPAGRIKRINKSGGSPLVAGGDGADNRIVEIYTYPR